MLTEKCIKCDGEIFESGSISRCLRCRRATEKEVPAEEYYKQKNKIGFVVKEEEKKGV